MSINSKCKLTTCLKDHAWRGDKMNRWLCRKLGHLFCDCELCSEYPTCLRCRLYTSNGDYL